MREGAENLQRLADEMRSVIDDAYRVLNDCEARLNPYQEPPPVKDDPPPPPRSRVRESAGSEAAILRYIRHALNQSGRVRVIRNTVGFDQTRNIRYGLGTGSPDLIGPLRDGRIFAVEVKTTRGRMSVEQCAWWMAARKWGVTGGVATSVGEAMALLDAAGA